jgi:archaemetzincin
MLAALAFVIAAATAPAERVVVILPMGKVNPAVLEAVSAALTEAADVKIRVDPQRELPKEAWYVPRKRWRAEKLLDAIDADLPEGAWRVVAITEGEISTTKDEYPDWGIVGLGSMGGPSCITSTHIFRKWSKTKDVLHRRVADSAVHELGHTLGLDHCESAGCVMRDAKGKAVTSADTSTGRFCEVCHGLQRDGVLKKLDDE